MDSSDSRGPARNVSGDKSRFGRAKRREEVLVEQIIPADIETIKHTGILKEVPEEKRNISHLCVLHQTQYKALHMFVLRIYLLNCTCYRSSWVPCCKGP